MSQSGYEIKFTGLKVAIVENELPTLLGMKYILENLGCEIIWTARDEKEALIAAQTNIPRVAFVDLRLLQGSDDYESGWELIRYLTQQGVTEAATVIICAGTPVVDEIVLEAIRIGCSYVVKEDLWDHEQAIIAAALLASQSRSVLLSNEVSGGVETIVNRMQDTTLLTEKEIEVLELVTEGFANQEIGQKLFIAESTVKTHVSHILRKLDVNNRGQAAEWYRQHFG